MPLDPNSWQLFANGISSWRDRRDRDKDQEYNRNRQEKLDQVEIENDLLRRQLMQQTLEASKFNLGESKKAATANDALLGFDPSLIGPNIPLPDGVQGPPAPGARPDMTKPFQAQAPDIQQALFQHMLSKGVPAPQTAQAFNAQHTARTGAPVMPQAPAGMRPSGFSMDGFQFEPQIELPPGARPSSTRVGNTTYDFPPPSEPAKVQPVLDATGNPMPGLYTGPDGKPHPLPRSAAPTEAQSNARIYAERMKFNEEALKGLSKQYDPTSMARLPEMEALRLLRSDAANQYTDAKRNWIAATLRKESGAAISNAEYVNADKQYFPQLGDGPEAIARKKALRELVQKEMESIGHPPQVELPFGGNTPPQLPAEPAPQQTAGTPDAPTPVNSQAEYDALPAGAWYMDSSGVPKQKRR